MPTTPQEPSDRDAAAALIASSTEIPAFGMDRHLTVFAVNDLAAAVLPTSAVGVNIARSVFLVERPRRSDAGWGLACEHVAAALKASLDRFGEDDEFITLVGELAALSADFAEVWARGATPTGTGTFRIPAPGAPAPGAPAPGSPPLELTYRLTSVADGSGDSVVTWEPADEASASILRRLSPPRA